MGELKLPVDVERLPEYRRLATAVGGANSAFLFLRLWVELAYHAQSRSRAGWLDESAAELLADSVRDMALPVISDQSPVISDQSRTWLPALDQLVSAGWLKKVADGYECERFARLNGHLSGDHKPNHIKGAEHSAHVRQRREVIAQAQMQQMLIAPEFFKHHDGTVMNSVEVNRAMVLIKTLDNCLRLSPPRGKAQFTEGLLADAAAVVKAYEPAALERFYFHVIDHRTHPGMPTTTEQILSNFPVLFGGMG